LPSRYEEEPEHLEIPFFPNFLLSEVCMALAVIGFLVIFVALFPVGMGEKFDVANPPTFLEPEWYFMALYQFLKTQNVAPLYGVLLSAILGVLLVLVPFMDKGSERRPLRRPLFTAVALVIIVQFIAMTIYGTLTPGQTGSFSDPVFVAAFAATNLLAVAFVLMVWIGHRRMKKGSK
jgi:quinol-cytochrome oxidoreductase complex cytochrome b subunit